MSKNGGQLAFYKNVPTTASRLTKVRLALSVVLGVNEKQENEQSVLTHNYIFAYKSTCSLKNGPVGSAAVAFHDWFYMSVLRVINITFLLVVSLLYEKGGTEN